MNREWDSSIVKMKTAKKQNGNFLVKTMELVIVTVELVSDFFEIFYSFRKLI